MLNLFRSRGGFSFVKKAASNPEEPSIEYLYFNNFGEGIDTFSDAVDVIKSYLETDSVENEYAYKPGGTTLIIQTENFGDIIFQVVSNDSNNENKAIWSPLMDASDRFTSLLGGASFVEKNDIELLVPNSSPSSMPASTFTKLYVYEDEDKNTTVASHIVVNEDFGYTEEKVLYDSFMQFAGLYSSTNGSIEANSLTDENTGITYATFTSDSTGENVSNVDTFLGLNQHSLFSAIDALSIGVGPTSLLNGTNYISQTTNIYGALARLDAEVKSAKDQSSITKFRNAFKAVFETDYTPPASDSVDAPVVGEVDPNAPIVAVEYLNGSSLSALFDNEGESLSNIETSDALLASFWNDGDLIIVNNVAYKIVDETESGQEKTLNTLKLSTEGVDALQDGDAFLVDYDFNDSPSGQETKALMVYQVVDNNTANLHQKGKVIKISDPDWDIATGINLSSTFSQTLNKSFLWDYDSVDITQGYWLGWDGANWRTYSNLTITSTDSVESAIGKICNVLNACCAQFDLLAEAPNVYQMISLMNIESDYDSLNPTTLIDTQEMAYANAGKVTLTAQKEVELDESLNYSEFRLEVFNPHKDVNDNGYDFNVDRAKFGHYTYNTGDPVDLIPLLKENGRNFHKMTIDIVVANTEDDSTEIYSSKVDAVCSSYENDSNFHYDYTEYAVLSCGQVNFDENNIPLTVDVEIEYLGKDPYPTLVIKANKSVNVTVNTTYYLDDKTTFQAGNH